MLARVDDIDVAWFEVGRGDPIVLVHGLADDHRSWRRVVAQLMLQRRVILYDFRGHGQSALGTPDGTLEQLARDLIGLIDLLALERAAVAGFSLGGTIAMRAAVDRPDRIAALALVGTSSRVNHAARAWYEARVDLVERGDPKLRATLDADTYDIYRRRPEETETGLTIRRQSTADPRGYANACRAMSGLNQAPLDEELSAIAIPTVILAGADDQHCPPRAGEIIAERISGSELRVLADTGHPLPIERPSEVVEAIAALRGG